MRGEWIEIYSTDPIIYKLSSLPMRGDWIEMTLSTTNLPSLSSLPMRGEWIEIAGRPPAPRKTRLSPCGESGLKYFGAEVLLPRLESLPMRGEWIEMKVSELDVTKIHVSPHAGRVD